MSEQPSKEAVEWVVEHEDSVRGSDLAGLAYDAGRASRDAVVNVTEFVDGVGMNLTDQINALPWPLRSFVHDLETRADPAGDLRSRRVAEDAVLALEAELARLAAKIERAKAVPEEEWNQVTGRDGFMETKGFKRGRAAVLAALED